MYFFFKNLKNILLTNIEKVYSIYLVTYLYIFYNLYLFYVLFSLLSFAIKYLSLLLLNIAFLFDHLNYCYITKKFFYKCNNKLLK